MTHRTLHIGQLENDGSGARYVAVGDKHLLSFGATSAMSSVGGDNHSYARKQHFQNDPGQACLARSGSVRCGRSGLTHDSHR